MPCGANRDRVLLATTTRDGRLRLWGRDDAEETGQILNVYGGPDTKVGPLRCPCPQHLRMFLRARGTSIRRAAALDDGKTQTDLPKSSLNPTLT